MKRKQIRFQSAGVAHNFEIGYVPSKVTVTNLTKWGTSGVVRSTWFKGDAADTANVETYSATGLISSVAAANGVTMYGKDVFPANYSAISAITAAAPPVVTVTSTAGWTTGDTVVIRNVKGMTQVNGIRYKITVVSPTTFSLQGIDGTGYTAWASGGEAYNISKNMTDSGFVGVTLGTAVIGVDNDIMVLECESDYADFDLGDIA